ncbi:hypothetical protein Bca52824_063720 [Brassica carinata]|uniref:Uncharacterized protein n=1 Tax=Brassica carinata TaxID=52824 RepID=A0A8X7QF98_BRACI|nr:hypothetical protein Bca52824_063720 [Brassica carinata]
MPMVLEIVQNKGWEFLVDEETGGRFNLNEEPAEFPNREEVGMSGEVSDDIDGEAELEEEYAKIDESDDENKCEKDMINGKYVRFLQLMF